MSVKRGKDSILLTPKCRSYQLKISKKKKKNADSFFFLDLGVGKSSFLDKNQKSTEHKGKKAS